MADIVLHPIAKPPPRRAHFAFVCNRTLELAGNVLSNPTTVMGLVLIIGLIGMAVFAPLLAEPNTPDSSQMPRDWGAIAVPPGSPDHILGTTNTGGDVWYGVVWGSRASLTPLVARGQRHRCHRRDRRKHRGFVGGRVDEILMRVVDVFLSIPELIFALAIAAVLGPSFRNIILALAIVSGSNTRASCAGRS